MERSPDGHLDPPRSAAIDLIKALAIVSVICLHSISYGTFRHTGGIFHIGQAVPVFVVLLGINGARSLRRRGGHGLRELYGNNYLALRFDRLYTPFLIVFAVALLAVGVFGGPHYSPYALGKRLLSGELPLIGPGEYFVTLLFQVAVLLPLLYWGIRRWPHRALFVCLMITIGYEVLMLDTNLTTTNAFFGEACIARYVLLMAIGCVIADTPPVRLLRSPWLWCGGALSVVYLSVSSYADTQATSVGQLSATVFYPTLLVVIGMTCRRFADGRLMQAAATTGRASYHIFLMQIVWFAIGVWGIDSLPALVGNIAVTVGVGVAFYKLMARWPPPSAVALLARQRKTARASVAAARPAR
ncbi:MAG TPA: acyltransferase [Solirubrobacteraceae bacterium]|jgi:peptidoglycan/LPS O-acetylase OafA/YrhL|nr:acyltransferase [Solirubrobacteraceae bacterium]